MLEIQRLTPQDWPRLRAVRLRALGDTPDAFWATAAEESLQTDDEWRARLEATDAVTVVACEDGVDLGLAVGAPHYDREGEVGLFAVWVAPEARGRGIARALIDEVISWARATGHRRISLDVGDANAAARALYAEVGFTPTGRSGAFPEPRQHITEHEQQLEL